MMSTVIFLQKKLVTKYIHGNSLLHDFGDFPLNFDCFDPDFKLIETQCRIFLELFVINALLLLLTTRGGGAAEV